MRSWLRVKQPPGPAVELPPDRWVLVLYFRVRSPRRSGSRLWLATKPVRLRLHLSELSPPPKRCAPTVECSGYASRREFAPAADTIASLAGLHPMPTETVLHSRLRAKLEGGRSFLLGESRLTPGRHKLPLGAGAVSG